MIHVGLNLVFMVPGQTGGMEIAARSVIPHLAAIDDIRLTALVNREGLGTLGQVAEQLVPVDATNRAQWVRGEQQLLPAIAQRCGCDVVHSLGSTAPLRGDFRRVTTIHDLNYKLVPGSHFGLRGLGMRALVPAAARRSHRVIVDAASTRDDLERHLGVAPVKVDVVPLAATERGRSSDSSQAALRARLGLGDRRIVLSVSAKRPHKNLLRLVEAHARLRAPRPLLVIPGYPTPHELELRERATALGTRDEVRLLPWLSDADIEGLYAAADVFAFPSLYEGFGLPPLEAMARGVPVVTSARGSLKEVVGDATLTVDPENVDEIGDALARLLADPALAERLAAAGSERAAQFTWRRTAELTAASYRRALGR